MVSGIHCGNRDGLRKNNVKQQNIVLPALEFLFLGYIQIIVETNQSNLCFRVIVPGKFLYFSCMAGKLL